MYLLSCSPHPITEPRQLLQLDFHPCVSTELDTGQCGGNDDFRKAVWMWNEFRSFVWMSPFYYLVSSPGAPTVDKLLTRRKQTAESLILSQRKAEIHFMNLRTPRRDRIYSEWWSPCKRLNLHISPLVIQVNSMEVIAKLWTHFPSFSFLNPQKEACASGFLLGEMADWYILLFINTTLASGIWDWPGW